MAVTHRLIEHWASGEDFTPDRRDMWLLRHEPQFGPPSDSWLIEYRRGSKGRPIQRRTFEGEEAARWGLAAWQEQCRQEAAGADWVQV